MRLNKWKKKKYELFVEFVKAYESKDNAAIERLWMPVLMENLYFLSKRYINAIERSHKDP